MADVTERLPFPISKRLASTVSEIINRDGREIHYTVAGVPFRLATTDQIPLTFETAQMQKNQQDTEPEAGEQTLSGWWLRSQASWHEGSGTLFPESSIGNNLRVATTAAYWQSSNVDPWTPGALTLLKDTVPVASTVAKDVAVIPNQTTHTCVVGEAGAVRRYTDLDVSAAQTDLYINGAVTFTQVVTSDLYWYAAGNDGKVYSGPVGAVTGAPKIWTLTGANTAKTTRIGWAKHRLFAVNANRIYWMDWATPGATAALYTHPSDAWNYTDIADSPGGVLFSGWGDGTSHIQKVSLNVDGTVPTMGGASTTAILPSDEKALRINSLTGQLVCILTNRGVRVAAAQTNGDLQYGPLFMERTTELLSTVKPALTSSGRFWWLAWGDETKMWRIDSSQEADDGHFAYASDMECAAFPLSITVRAGRVITALSSGAVAYQHKTRLCPLGTAQTGRIRFRTDEVKSFVYCDVAAEPLRGIVSLDLLNSADTETRLVTWSVQGVALSTAQVPPGFGAQRFVSAKLTLQRSVLDDTQGPVIQGVRVKALPAQKPQRIYTLPLACYDHERWSNGQEEGYEGFGRDRYLSVRSAEDAGGVTLLVNYGFPSPVGELVKIEELKFIQLTQPNARQLNGGLGGILMASLRTLT